MMWAAWLFLRPSRRPVASARKLRFESLEHREVPASLAGNVFRDFGNDGALNGPDTALNGVTVRVSGGSLTAPQTATTDTSGNFSLTGLAAGTYTLTVTAPTGVVAGKSTAGTANGTAGTTNTVTGIVLGATDDATGYRFGQVPNALTTGGKVFNDANANGTLDTGETGIAGVTVTLTGTSVLTGAAIAPKTATTGIDGSYSFTGLTPGTYSIAETPKTGFVRGTLINGTPAAASTATGAFTGIDLTSTASASTGFNFADVRPTTLAITQSVDLARAKPGDTVNITLVAKNNGPQSATALAASVNLDGLTFVSATGTGYTAGTKTWSIGTLTSGQTATLVLKVTVPSKGLFQPSSRLVSTTTGTTIVGATGFGTVNAGGLGISMQNFLASTYKSQAILGSSNSVAFPIAPTNAGSAPATPTVQFFNSTGATQLTNASTAEPLTVIKGTTSPNTAVTILETGATATSDSSGNFSFTGVVLNIGANPFTVRAGAGTLTSQTAAIVTRTGTAPTIPTVQFFDSAGTTQLTNATTTGTTVTIKGTTDPNTPLTLVETGATATSDSTGNYNFTSVSVTVGSNSFTVRAGAGNSTSQRTSTVTRTAVAPATPTITAFDSAGTTALTNNTTSETTVTLKGTTDPNTLVTLLGVGTTTTSDSSGNYSFAGVAAATGANTYTVRAGTGTLTSQSNATVTRTAPNVAPTIASQQGAVTLSSTTASQTIDLAGNFTDDNLGIDQVKFTTSSGDITIDLFAKDAPRTVANFENYVTSGRYDNSIFHRRATGFVLQGGGFAFDNTGSTPTINTITTDPAVQNEPDIVNRSNLKGTIAMAKLGGNPNSATDQFFFNLADNSSNLNSQNGGFTVFGRLNSAADQAVVDALAAIPIQNQSGAAALTPEQQSAFDTIPLTNYTGTAFPTDTTLANYAAITSATIITQPEKLTYSIVSNSNTAAVTTAIANNRLTVTQVTGQTGSATIVVRATDKGGLTRDMTFTVNAT